MRSRYCGEGLFGVAMLHASKRSQEAPEGAVRERWATKKGQYERCKRSMDAHSFRPATS